MNIELEIETSEQRIRETIAKSLLIVPANCPVCRAARWSENERLAMFVEGGGACMCGNVFWVTAEFRVATPNDPSSPTESA